MKRKLAKIITLAILLVLAIVMGKLSTKTSFGADNEERAILEGAFTKYVNYELADGSKGTLVQYSIRTGIKYEKDFFAIRNTELNASLSPIDGKYPYDVKVIVNNTKATNGKTSDISEDYSYDPITGIVTIRTNNENEKGEAINNAKPGEDDRDDFIIIAYYDTYTKEKVERELSCNVTYKAELFTEDKREVIGQGGLSNKVTEDVGELTTVRTNVSEIYNGYIKSNIINGTTYDTEYTENNEIEISKKEAHQKIKITEENTFINPNDIYYKSTKISKDDITKVLGENGSIEIIDGNNNVIAKVDNNTEFNENGEYIVTYGEEVNNITIRTSNIEKEGILHIENVKVLRSNISNIEDKDIVRKISIIGINEKEVEVTEETNLEEELNEEQTLNLNTETLNLNIDTNENDKTTKSTENQNKDIEEPNKIKTQIIEEESYKTDKQNIIEIKDSIDNVNLSLNNAEWSNNGQNDVNFVISFDSSSSKYTLFRNPVIKIDLPSEIEKVILGDSTLLYGNGLSLSNITTKENENGSISILATLEGSQTHYEENNLGLTTTLTIPSKIFIKKDVENTINSEVNVQYTNNYNGVQGKINKSVKIVAYRNEGLKENISEEKETNIETIIKEKQEEIIDDIKKSINMDEYGLTIDVQAYKGDENKPLDNGDVVYPGEYITYKIEYKTEKNIDSLKFSLNIPEGLTYGKLNSKFDEMYEGVYEYEFFQNQKEITIDAGSVNSGITYVKHVDCKVDDLSENESSRNIETTIKTFISEEEVESTIISNTIEKGKAKIYLQPYLDGYLGEWFYRITLESPEEETSIVKLVFPEGVRVEQETIDNSQSFVNPLSENLKVEDYQYEFGRDEETGRDYVTINISHGGNLILGASIKILDQSKVLELYKESKKNTISDEDVNMRAYATMEVGDETYYSNEAKSKIKTYEASVTMTSENEGEEVEVGEEINYNINVKCLSTRVDNIKAMSIRVTDYLPKDVDIKRVTYEYFETTYEEGDNDSGIVTGFSEKKTKTEDVFYTKTDEDGNILPDIDFQVLIPEGEEINIFVETTAGWVAEKTEIENSATIQDEQFSVEENDEKQEFIDPQTSNVVKHIIIPKKEEAEDPIDPDEPTDPEDPDNPNNPDEPIDPNAKYSISGVAWNDINGDGQRQSSEDLIAGIKVMLVDLSNSSKVKSQATTNNNGEYSFQDLEQANYIVVFRYDTSSYTITDYRKSGVSENVNSDAIEQNIIIDGERVDVGVTNEINLNKNESNIDIGLIGKNDYDLKLDKYITDVTVTTRNGTKQYSYDNTKLGRVEIRAKELNGAKVLVKYRIVITNEGKSTAKIKEIYDYLPEGLDFPTSESDNWTEDNGVLVNRSLSGQTIAPGESKEVTLTLSKTMNEENTGTFTNAAEIGSVDAGVNGIKDADSTPGNGNKSEDDYSEAELIIGVSTGIVMYITIGIIIALVIAIGLAIIIKFKISHKTIVKLGVFLGTVIIVGMTATTSVYAGIPTYGSYKWIGAHTFSGTPGGGGTCSTYNKRAAGNGCEHYAVGYVSYRYGNSLTGSYFSGEVAGTRVTLSDPIDLKKKNELIEVTSKDGYYILGPFEVESNSTNDCIVTVYNKSGGVVTGWAACDANGNTWSKVPGNTTFYLKLTESQFENGVSRVSLRQSKLYKYTYHVYKYARALYVLYDANANLPCETQAFDAAGNATGGWIIGYGHQSVWSYQFIVGEEERTKEEETWAEIEWTDFNSSLDIIKADADDHEVVMDIEGNLRKDDGTFNEDFKTVNGKYHWDNLKPGNYTVTEYENNNYGYEKNAPKSETFYLDSGLLLKYYFENIKYTGNIKIIKRDKDTGDPMSDIGFKLYKEDEGYVIGINASGGPIRQARGSVQFHNMEYTQDPSQATEFITGDDGEMNIYNIRIGTYRVEEVSVNIPIYGYDLDEEYVYWSSNLGSGEHELIGRVEVIRRKSYYTTAKGGGAYPTSTPDSEFDTITFENRRKWVKLSGKVWEDMIDAKDSTRNYALDEGGADKLVANVTVRLKDKSGSIVPFKTSEDTEATVTQIDTDSNGAYTMVDVLIDEIPNYYIEFSYNGMSFTSVPVLDSPSLDSDNYNGTRAIESEAERTEFNRKYSEITHSGSTGPIGESRDDGGSKTYNLNYHENEKYELEDGTIIDQIKSTLNYGEGSNSYGYEDAKFPVNHIDEQYMITASTKEAFTQKGYSGYLSDMKTPEEIRTQDNGAGQYHGVEEITNMNLGIREREQPDLALVEDIEQVQIDLNGYTHTYNYNQRFENQEEYGDGFDIGVKFGNKYGKQEYTQAIYPSDVVYNQGHENALGIYVRYKIALRNESTTLYSRVNEVINHYDANYEIPQDDIVVTAVVDEAGVGLQYTEEGGSGAFKKVTIQANQDLAPQETKYIYITYRLTNDAVNQLLDGIAPIESVTEIGSYSTYENGFSIHYAGVDKDSRPGSAEPGNEETYEDDTDSAPSFLLEVQELRELKGTVWEDEAVQELLNISQEEIDAGKRKERIGNGEYEDSENVLQDVKVELLVLSYEEDSEIDLANASLLSGGNVQDIPQATLYTDNWQTDGTPAETMTGTDGSYTFSGVIPGKYILRFTYGDESVIVYADGTGSEKIEDVDKYKSTIYRGNRPENESTANGDTDYWYRNANEIGESASRWSDARDEVGIKGLDGSETKFDLLAERLGGEKEYYYGNTDPSFDSVKADATKAIEARTRGFEIRMDYNTETGDVSEYFDKEEGKIISTFDNLDFGIIRRPIQRLNVKKEIAYVKVTLANGQVLVEGDPRTEEIQHLKFLPDGNVHIEIDSEIIQGATLTIKYEIIADNTQSELDYDDSGYYIFGTPDDPNTEIAPQPKRILDYLSNDLIFNEENNPDWSQCEIEELKEWFEGEKQYFSEDAYNAISKFNQVLQTDAFADMKIEKRSAFLEVSRVLSNKADDFIFENDMEINILTGRRTTKDGTEDEYTIPGNYIPSNGETGGDDDYVYLTITGPTGDNQNYIPYIVLGISAFIILGTGIVFIKKKVV